MRVDWSQECIQINELTPGSHLKPSCGWIEHEEIDWTFRSDDGTLQDDNFAKTWQELYFDAMDRAGRSVRIDPRLTRRRLEQSGFVDIELEVVKLPCNGWPQDAAERGLGRWFNLGISYSIEPFSLAPLCVFSNYSADDARRMKARVQAAISAREVHAYCNLYVRRRECHFFSGSSVALVAGPWSRH